jgi:drug/metabolite transporter (DMT)-like permease
VDYATTLLAAVLLGVGFVLQQYAAEQEPESQFLRLGILTDLLRKPRWLLGISCMIGGYLVAAWSIDHLELTLVEPLLTTYLVWALVLAVPLSRQAVKATEVVGAVILIAGVALVSASRSITPIGLDFGSFSHWYAAAIIAGVALVAVVIGHHRTGQVRATLTGLAAGLVFGIQDALTRQTLQSLQGTSWTTLFTHWSTYALVGAGIVGIWLMQNAFSAAPLHASLPAIAAGEPLAGIALGILVFGDRVQITPGLLAIEAGGIVALIVGVIVVARSPAFTRLRRITEVIRPGTEAADSRDPAEPAPEAPAAPNHTAPHRTATDRPVGETFSTIPSAGVRGDGPVARKFSRPAHGHDFRDSPSADGRLTRQAQGRWRAGNPQAAAAKTVSPNSRNVSACTLVQYRQMFPMMKSSA